ncbi:hypothetical protein [Bradyrhizobium hereditatis]|uniref:hypothetical protein n=1 Tax=Bradyrhizobium hereditatis TaxID=2821405 RepID=UPI004064744D
MHSIVCTKQVPDSAQVRVNPLTNTIVRQAAKHHQPLCLVRAGGRAPICDKFGGEITTLTTVDAERRAERGVQKLRAKLLVNHGGSNQPNLPRRDEGRPARGAGAGCKMERAGGRRRGVSKCVVLGSPTIVKRAFAPSPRAEKAGLVEAPKQPMEVLMKAILKGQPNLETDLVAQARKF